MGSSRHLTVSKLAVVLLLFLPHTSALHGYRWRRNRIPCPPKGGGLVTHGEPDNPEPFHDLTLEELRGLYDFLFKRPELNLGPPKETMVNTSSIFMVDLLLPSKGVVLSFLDQEGPRPPREARVMMFRGDKPQPLVEEYRVGPLPSPTDIELISSSKRKNPVPFAVRPIGTTEFDAIYHVLLPKVDKKVGHVLMESYGGLFTKCGDRCLTFWVSPLGTNIIGRTTRLIWIFTDYPVEYLSVYPVDFAILADMESSDPDKWKVVQVWYSDTFYSSLEELADRYIYDPDIPRTNRTYPEKPEPWSVIKQRGEPFPKTPQRPPVQIELDGKRYSVEHRHVNYLQWSFDVRLSSFKGPQVYDVRYKGERIAYEVGLAEVAVFYSGAGPSRITNYVDSGVLIGTHSKSLVEGADCPEGATFLSVKFLGELMEEPITLERAVCVFEHNTGIPLFRHMSYSKGMGAFFGGMSDSVLIVRSSMAIFNYDYIMDFVFHQDGSLETRLLSTGYIIPRTWSPEEDPYGWRLRQPFFGSLHYHMFHVKADVDIEGPSNRYEQLNIVPEQVILKQNGKPYSQTRFERKLVKTEEEALYKFDFDHPKYHIVHNDQFKTEFGAPRAYRIIHGGMGKQLLPEEASNEKTVPWSRYQMAVTVHDDEEARAGSSSPYGMFDSLDPVVNFPSYINGQSIVDEHPGAASQDLISSLKSIIPFHDLVFWMTLGTHHLPHNEDLPITPTVGRHLSFFLVPYNYFDENPAVSSRDIVRVELKDSKHGKNKLVVTKTLVKKNGFCRRETLADVARRNPDAILQTTRDFTLQ